jgi:hypothetical protein
VIEEQKDQVKKAAAGAPTSPDTEKLSKDLAKAQAELKEAAVEKERFQAQLEMLVQELEQKQVRMFYDLMNKNVPLFAVKTEYVETILMM